MTLPMHTSGSKLTVTYVTVDSCVTSEVAIKTSTSHNQRFVAWTVVKPHSPLQR